ncbi:hypothetical protein A2276_06970 [candidate division WOR-1 bacterium RIFOXYA12_FULL_43_27]|uniref:Uncharacterized protein n=1 Tax=candidate division WOR-1 bacterium RIFOXYC2_FULL_46_14 TaxID=1802587 RepID=A0A1F4U5M6_UNCSA|nr:MAG: hypothetical protein A2276_06970 [candidate division WOR-1 bacterium RIFOXYA12_FULL_43_27]OGC20386.1 MAG: hypothetical protein A2292_04970 [candidate division WOR-1 bacterium RIFOXYB2_FULL_46_45]OGC31877.1 MAG: hypothetical protein A2232_06480 [candidate division WOR-1 bacterium RIFOXYA2_FULL_46_56]OGC40232.1 MAG: hypothetical protein A2438_02990 [candidate division WOR-1 bacterium RIFOXYC2_FULL_46_14]
MIFGRRKEKETQALIMAAGYGTRLEPLTTAVPKPMMPIVNKPCMLHNLELLKRYGIKRVTCNIHYHPEQIENYFMDGEKFGVSLSYSYEEKLLGTAGGVKKMGEGIDRTFIVLSSDALTDINLSKMLAFHKEKGVLATMALCEVSDVTQFGVVVLDEKSGRVTAFQEKPKQEEALSRLVNTGIYIFEPEILDMIPEGKPYDFGKELFPLLAAEGRALYGYKMLGYWSDVGTIKTYLEANRDAMLGKVGVHIPGSRISSANWIGRNSKISKTAEFKGSVLIGDHTVIEDEVEIKNSVIGDRVVVSRGSKILDSVIWSDSIILSSSQIKESVVGSWCYIGKGSKVSFSALANRTRV